MRYSKFLKDRDEIAKLPLNKKKILKYMKKYHIPCDFSSDLVMYAGIHKMRLELHSIDTQGKLESIDWLIQNGFKCDMQGNDLVKLKEVLYGN